MRKPIFPAALVAVLIASPLFAQMIDGSRTSPGDNYGSPIAVQQVQTQFGDPAGSELDAVYAYNDANNLYLMFTGNVESNFNKFEVFIDSIPEAGENVITADVQSGGNNPDNDGWADRFALPAPNPGFTFDEGFAADFLMIFRSGTDGTPKADLDFNTVGNDSFVESVFELFGQNLEGSDGLLPISGIVVGFDNSNVLGVTGGTEAADQTAAAAVETGVEFMIPLTAIGVAPGDTIKICAFVNGTNHDYASNQFMAPLAAPQGNLGSTGMGGDGTGSVSLVNMNDFAGDQFFEVTLTTPGPVVVPGESLTVAPGIISSGGLPDLEQSDNVSLVLFRDPTSTAAVTQFVLTSTSPTATPSAFDFVLEGRCVSRPNIVQRVEFFNYVTAAFETVDEQNAVRMPPDLSITVTPTGDLSRFVDPSTLEIEARVRYRADSPRASFSSRTDQAVWMIQ